MTRGFYELAPRFPARGRQGGQKLLRLRASDRCETGEASASREGLPNQDSDPDAVPRRISRRIARLYQLSLIHAALAAREAGRSVIPSAPLGVGRAAYTRKRSRGRAMINEFINVEPEASQ